MTLLPEALWYAARGMEVFPAHPQTKAPLCEHGNKDGTTDEAQIRSWWDAHPQALVAHRLSAGHIILDIDPGRGGMDTWRELKVRLTAPPRTRTHYSGRGDGGGHVWFQRPEGHLGVVGLNAWAADNGVGRDMGGRWIAGIDLLTREHRYSILPPSPHPATGEPYYWAEGRGLEIEPAPMPDELAELLTVSPPPRANEAWVPGMRQMGPAEWYSRTRSWTDVLGPRGWMLVTGDGEEDGSTWRHPEATNDRSATIRHGCLFVYSTGTPFEPTGESEPHGYTPFAAYAVLEHRGDQSHAAREIRSWMSTSASRERSNGEEAATDTGPSDDERHIDVTWASSIVLRRVRWVWEGRLAIGSLGLLAGPEGLGKSTVACWMGAELTRGLLPGEYFGEPKAVLVAATEDSWEQTIAPRFLAAGADLTRVGRIDVRTKAGLTLPIEFPTDEERFARMLAEIEPAVVILDPLISRLSRTLDSHKDAEVRTALEPLVAIAGQAGVALVGLIHHNKSGSTNPLDLVMASKAFTGVARSVHTVIRDPEDEGGARRYLGTPKNNLGSADLSTKSFTITPWHYQASDGEGVTGQIAWGVDHAEPIDLILRRAAQAAKAERGTKRRSAGEWITDTLRAGGGELKAKDMVANGAKKGYSRATLYRARDDLVEAGTLVDIHGTWRLVEIL
jgi:hypothetical protein